MSKEKENILSEVRALVRQTLKEFMTQRDLDKVEDYADDMFNPIGIDVEFTHHFVDRLNDPRNQKDIESEELKDLFKKLYLKHGQRLPNFRKGTHAVVSDMNSNINIPIELRWDANRKEFDMMNMTVMRKKNFYTKDLPLKV